MPYKYCEIYRYGESQPLFSRISIPVSFFQRAKGLLGKNGLVEHQGMLFKDCNSIHMMGMKEPLDIVFLLPNAKIIKCVESVKPWRMAFCSKAKMTLELPAGTIKKVGLSPIMKLEINHL